MTHAENTDYPQLFEKTYWGGFSKEVPDSKIVENRNNFVKKYGLSKVVDKRPMFISHHLGDKLNGSRITIQHISKLMSEDPYPCPTDHTEVYTSAKNSWYIIITSPYRASVSETDHQAFLKEGWEPTDPLYNPAAITYVKVIDKIKKTLIFPFKEV